MLECMQQRLQLSNIRNQHLKSLAVTSGRALSCIAARFELSSICEKPLNTESWRSLPGAAHLTGMFLAILGMCSSNIGLHLESQALTPLL